MLFAIKTIKKIENKLFKINMGYILKSTGIFSHSNRGKNRAIFSNKICSIFKLTETNFCSK